ncbi:hypothetical protein Mesop_4345 [Mesorhizobium opportunistum WSM2075]|uniref:Uncharacterized protein n=1 Tax=Mesorhizobium opportunistum (strain LMG 24607 / HAMBI 3007 / WSM2075) TaxID=536019 RepID=F7Y9P8_MESOW|nr:hypothetical protein Mesop_4345 [Mesorhizobium opportunistum WSM2075]
MSGAPVCGRASIEDFRDKAELNGLCRRQVAVRLRPSRATLFLTRHENARSQFEHHAYETMQTGRRTAG